MKNFNTGWYLIYTRPRHEKKLAVSLSESEVHNFLPTVSRLRNWNDRRRFVDTPLFPSYIFVYVKSMEEYFKALTMQGALYYVRSGKEVARIDESIICNIRLIAQQGEEVEVSDGVFKSGQQLVVQQGPLTGLNCEVVRYCGKEKLLVRVYLLQRNLLLNVPAGHLTAAQAC